MQGQIWGETVRLPDHLHNLLFPRMLALAERAWHKANWEGEPDVIKRTSLQIADWKDWVNTLGCKELQRLENAGVNYYLPVPEARYVYRFLYTCLYYIL